MPYAVNQQHHMAGQQTLLKQLQAHNQRRSHHTRPREWLLSQEVHAYLQVHIPQRHNKYLNVSPRAYLLIAKTTVC